MIYTKDKIDNILNEYITIENLNDTIEEQNNKINNCIIREDIIKEENEEDIKIYSKDKIDKMIDDIEPKKIILNNNFNITAEKIKINFIIDIDEDTKTDLLNGINEFKISKEYIGKIIKYEKDNKEYVNIDIIQFIIDNNFYNNTAYYIIIESIEINDIIYDTTEINPLINYYAFNNNYSITNRGTILFQKLYDKGNNCYYYLNKLNSGGSNSPFSNLYTYCLSFNNIIFSRDII